MGIATLRQKMSREEAKSKAEKKDDWLWNIVFFNRPLTEMRLIYFEYLLLELETTSSPSPVQRLTKREMLPVKKQLQVLVNGTSGGVALVVDDDLDMIEMEFDEDIEFQNTNLTDEDVISKAKKLAHKVTHRTMGGMHEARVISYESVYRPFWVAFYGEVKEGNKVRYITIAADGGQNQRVR